MISFSVASSSTSNGVTEEFNRVGEGYELFLTSEKPQERDLKLNYLINQRVKIYDKDGIRISIEIGKYVNPGKCLKACVIFEKENEYVPRTISPTEIFGLNAPAEPILIIFLTL